MARDRSIHRMLLLRAAVATVAVSTVAAVVVAWREQDRTSQLFSERAGQGAGQLQAALLPLLDTGLANRTAVQDALERVQEWSAGSGGGRFVDAAVFDAGGAEVARVSLPGHPPAGAAGLVPVAVPLLSSSGRPVGRLEAWFDVSAEERFEARRRLGGSVALAVGLVLVTAALLYPLVARMVRRLEALSLSLLDANLETLGLVGNAVARRDGGTGAHHYRVTVYAAAIAEAAGFPGEEMRGLLKGAFLHDVGKLGVSDAVLLKPGRLDAQEVGEMQRHVGHGLDLIGASTWLSDATPVVGHHHERWDGSGYGSGLRGEAIPLAARIFAVAEVFDALTSSRPYRHPLTIEVALAILEQGRGTHFDPGVLDLFEPIAHEIHRRIVVDDARAREEVTALMQRHFRGHLGALFPERS